LGGLAGSVCGSELNNTRQVAMRDEQEIRLAVERASRVLLSGIIENVV